MNANSPFNKRCVFSFIYFFCCCSIHSCRCRFDVHAIVSVFRFIVCRLRFFSRFVAERFAFAASKMHVFSWQESENGKRHQIAAVDWEHCAKLGYIIGSSRRTGTNEKVKTLFERGRRVENTISHGASPWTRSRSGALVSSLKSQEIVKSRRYA